MVQTVVREMQRKEEMGKSNRTVGIEVVNSEDQIKARTRGEIQAKRGALIIVLKLWQ